MKKNNCNVRSIGDWGKRLLLATPAVIFLNTAVAEPSVQTQPNGATVAIDSAYVLPGESALEAEVAAKPWRISGKPQLKSNSVIIIDEADSSVLYSKRAGVPMPVASITKLMTALVVLEQQQPMDELIMITAEDRDTEKGTTSRLAVGIELRRGDLLHLALMASENRAASALGRNYPGGLPTFVAAMNDKAKELGMTSARFVEPTGLSKDNVSSAEDLIKLVNAASQNTVISEFSTYQNYGVRVGRELLEFRSTNSLVANPGWQIALQKTGFTNEAGRCLVMRAFIQDRPVLIVLLNSVGKYTRVADALRIRRWMEAGVAPTDAVASNSRTL